MNCLRAWWLEWRHPLYRFPECPPISLVKLDAILRWEYVPVIREQMNRPIRGSTDGTPT